MPPTVASLSAPVNTEKPDSVIPSCRRYCMTWFFGVVLLVTLIGTFNALVDPYHIIGTPRVMGLNAAKPAAVRHTQLAKDYLIGRVKPAGLLLGTSKVDIGLNPRSRFWPEDARPVFNYGVPGTSVQSNLANLRRAVGLGTVRRALVVLEFGDFMRTPLDDSAVAPVTETPFKRVHDIALTTLTLDALRASIETVIAQQQPDPIDLSPDGATSDQGFRKTVRIDGYETFFLQKDAQTGRWLAWLAASLRDQPGAGLASLGTVAEIIALCQRHGIALDFALPPAHADLLVQIDRAGLWSRYQSVKAALTDLIASEGQQAVRLWDFSGFDAISTEPIPTPARPAVDMLWFWEPNHFKRALGEIMLSVIYGGVAGYGVLLTPGTVEAHLAQETAARDVWMASDTGNWRERLAHAARR